MGNNDKLKFAVIGHFANGQNRNDGQTVKTHNIAELLEKTYRCKVTRVDTYNYLRHPIHLLINTIQCLASSEYVFVLLSRNGRAILLPIIALFSKLTGSKIYHCLIGGKLADDVESYPWMVRMLNSLEVNWVETHLLVRRLQALGIQNAAYLPNFKFYKPVDMAQRVYSDKPPYKLCTFSRVIREKGILDAVAAVEALNRNRGFDYCKLDIYGPIDKSFEETFLKTVRSAQSCSYGGSVPTELAVETLSHYDCLLFPTLWEAEGIPGTVIDALAAGLPVIAYKWTYYDEILEDGITGYSVAPGNIEELTSTIGLMLEHDQIMSKFGHQCICRSERFLSENASRIIGSAIDV